MSHRRVAIVAATLAAALSLSACANTIRGAGADVGNTVSATQGAVADVARR